MTSGRFFMTGQVRFAKLTVNAFINVCIDSVLKVTSYWPKRVGDIKAFYETEF